MRTKQLSYYPTYEFTAASRWRKVLFA